MIDCNPFHIFKKPKLTYKDFKIVHRCYACGKRIKTIWENNYAKGDFHVGDIFWSDYLDCAVPFPDQVICFDCYQERIKNNLTVYSI